MEPFCVILKRTLSSLHPLNQILKYHCRELVVPNTLGFPTLHEEAHVFDQLFPHGRVGTFRLLRAGHALSTWEITDLRAEIKVLVGFSRSRLVTAPDVLRAPQCKFPKQ